MTADSLTVASLRRRALLLGAAGAGIAAGHAQAQPPAGPWPAAPVRYINLFSPGGSTDILSRLYCAAISDKAGQQFIVEPRTGAGGTVGQASIAQADPDGYTIGLGSVASLSIAPSMYPHLVYDPARDFTYVSGIWKLPNVLLVNNDFPATTLEEVIAELRRHPDRYSYGSSGSGTSPHLSMELLKQRAGVQALHVPYRGSAPAMLDLGAGRVQLMFDNIPLAVAAARQGRVRLIAVTSTERCPAAPDVPTMASVLPGYEITSWGCVVGPAGLPQPVVSRLSALTQEVLESPRLISSFADLGATPWKIDGAGLLAFRAEQEALFARLIRASGAASRS